MKILPVTVESVMSRADRTWKIVLGTQELTPEDRSGVTDLAGEMCYVGFKKEAFSKDETSLMESLKANIDDVNIKSPAKRLKAVLFVWYQKDKAGFKEFESFYVHYMEIFISHVKSKLDPI